MSICIDIGKKNEQSTIEKRIEHLPILLQLSWILPKNDFMFEIGNMNSKPVNSKV